MKISVAVLSLALCSQTTLAAWGASKSIYNKWHETELERWLADHNIPFPDASDRKSLTELVKQNWEGYVVAPYQNWDTKQQADWLSEKGVQVSDKQAQNADWLKAQIQKNWYENEASAEESYGDAKSWIFDTWTESQLKSYLDYHNIPSPKLRNRDSYLSTARSNYATVSQKAGESAAYPGDWLFKQWSDSDLKYWLDSHGYPAPQGTKRNQLIASVRRNSRSANQRVTEVQDSVSQKIFNSWSDSELKEWFDKNNIPVPQNGKKDELIALARKNKASLTADTYSASYTSALKAYGASTGSAASRVSSATSVAYDSARAATDAAYASANSAASVASASAASLTDAAYDSARAVTDVAYSSAYSVASVASASAASATDAAYDYAVGAKNSVYDTVAGTYYSLADKTLSTWSESRLKAFLDSRGVPVPQNGKKDELVALARLHKHKAATGYSAWTFDTWTYDNLKKWLEGQGHKVEKNSAATRDELAASANVAYASASSAGGSGFASVTSALSAATQTAKDTTFETWTDSEIKSYLDSYGVQTYQGTTKNQLVAKARRYNKIFQSGWRQETAFERFQRQAWAVWGQIVGVSSDAAAQASVKGQEYASSVSSAASSGTAAVKQEL